VVPDESIDHDFDAFWKESLEAFLGPFLELVAPRIHAVIDWMKPVTPLDNWRRGTPGAVPGRGGAPR